MAWRSGGRAIIAESRSWWRRRPVARSAARAVTRAAAIASRSPYCLANVPRTPQRTLRPHPLAQTRPQSNPVPRKKRHFPAPPVPGHAPSNPTHVLPIPTPAQFLPTNPPQSRNLANLLDVYAHPCYPRSREGPTPRPGNPTPKRGLVPGIRGDVENWPPATDHRPVPLSSSAT